MKTTPCSSSVGLRAGGRHGDLGLPRCPMGAVASKGMGMSISSKMRKNTGDFLIFLDEDLIFLDEDDEDQKKNDFFLLSFIDFK